jgi:hypothetical protein
VTGLRRKYERGLEEVELTRDLLHLLCGKIVCMRQHSQLISAEAGLGEHITNVVAVFQRRILNSRLNVTKKTERRL